MDSDMYPNNGSYYQIDTPDDRKKEENEVKSKVKAALPVVEDIIERFEERINFYDSLGSIPTAVRGDKEKFMLTVSANDMAKQVLTQEMEYLITLRDQYKD